MFVCVWSHLLEAKISKRERGEPWGRKERGDQEKLNNHGGLKGIEDREGRTTMETWRNQRVN